MSNCRSCGHRASPGSSTRCVFRSGHLAALQAAYLDRGFVNVKVEKPWVSISSDKRYIYVTIPVEEGEQYSIGRLDFAGDLLLPKDRLRKLMGSSEGELFNRSKLAKDI